MAERRWRWYNGRRRDGRPTALNQAAYPPTAPNLVPRPRLIRRLDDAFQQAHRLILVSAPAGSGKTTLLEKLRQMMGDPCLPERAHIVLLSVEPGESLVRSQRLCQEAGTAHSRG